MQIAAEITQGIADAAPVSRAELVGGIGHGLILPAADRFALTLKGSLRLLMPLTPEGWTLLKTLWGSGVGAQSRSRNC